MKQPYKDHTKDIGKLLGEDKGPEVALAIKLSVSAEPQKIPDEEDLEEFFVDNGLEYVDADISEDGNEADDPQPFSGKRLRICYVFPFLF